MTETTDAVTIAEAADRTGLSAHTLRYYERIGLIGDVPRDADGRRRYGASDLAWLAFLVRLRATGMPIRAMQQFADLRREGEATIASRRLLLEGHRDGVASRIAELQTDLAAITEKIDHYRRLESEHGHDDE